MAISAASVCAGRKVAHTLAPLQQSEVLEQPPPPLLLLLRVTLSGTVIVRYLRLLIVGAGAGAAFKVEQHNTLICLELVEGSPHSVYEPRISGCSTNEKRVRHVYPECKCQGSGSES